MIASLPHFYHSGGVSFYLMARWPLASGVVTPTYLLMIPKSVPLALPLLMNSSSSYWTSWMFHKHLNCKYP